MNIVEVKNLTKTFGEFTAVDHIAFSIKQGELLGFLGPNGAGKTTTINMLTGLARITDGSVRIGDIDAGKHVKRAQHLMGIVPDESNLYMEMDGFDNLCFCASLYGIGKAKREKRAHELLKIFSLTDAGKRPFKAYSKGMKRKLTIAAGIIHEPKILFLDEPTTGIDVESSRQIRQLIRKLHEEGTTIFLTTHYIEEAQRLCDRIAFIVEGHIVQVGTIEKLMRDVQKDNIVQFTLDQPVAKVTGLLQMEMSDYRFDMVSDDTIRLYTDTTVSLMPFIEFFDQQGYRVYEAKVIQPSLEDVFVNITGIGTREMRKERERKK